MRYVNCSASDYWSLACTEPVTQLWLTCQTRNAFCLASLHFIQHRFFVPAPDSLTWRLNSMLTLSPSHLEVYPGHLYTLNQILFSFQHYFKCKYRVFIFRVSTNHASLWYDQNVCLLFYIASLTIRTTFCTIIKGKSSHNFSSFWPHIHFLTLN